MAELRKIAEIRTDFPEKFGIPRQSGLSHAKGRIVFEPAYRNPDALRGIEEYDYLWLIWGFSENRDDAFRPTVRPPRLGGNERVGVFATRSPYRPNPIGLSCVRLIGVQKERDGSFVLMVEGVDMVDRTPIYDIKPYLPYIDAKTEARGGFADRTKGYTLNVEFPENAVDFFTVSELEEVRELLSQDPRPSYQDDPQRIYGMRYAGRNIRFRVEKGSLVVLEISVED